MDQSAKSLAAGIRDFTEAIQRYQEAIRQLELLTKPRKDNLNEIPALYESFAGFSKKTGRERRRQFVMIALYFYSPGSLVDGRVSFKIKSALAETLGVSVRNIEYMTKDILFMYDHYADFREGVDAGIEFIKNF